MVSNAQLDNEKANLIYQVDTLKDVIEEMEEQTSEMKRELEDKSKVTCLLINTWSFNCKTHSCYCLFSPSLFRNWKDRSTCVQSYSINRKN